MTKYDFEEQRQFLSIATAYIRRELYDEAALLAEKRLARDNGDAGAAFIRAICLIGMGHVKEADDILQSIGHMLSQWFELYHLLGETYRKSELTSEAARANHTANVLKSVLDGHGKVSGKPEDQTVSESEQGNVSELGEISSDFHTLTLADLYVKQGHLAMARSVLKSITAREPDNVGARERLGYVETVLSGKIRHANNAVINELNRWMKNLENRKHQP